VLKLSSSGFFINASRCRYFLGLAFVLACYLAYAALFSSDNGFLRPTPNGHWILAPRTIALQANGACHAAIFRKEIYLPSTAGWGAPVRATIAAAQGYQFYVNSHLISDWSEKNFSRNWKHSQTFDISRLLHAGKNIMEVVVGNNTRVPALLVTGSVRLDSGQSEYFDTDFSWRVASVGTPNWTVPEPIVALQDFYPGHLAASPYMRPGSRFLRIAASALAYLLIGMAIVIYSFGRSQTKSIPWPSDNEMPVPIKPGRSWPRIALPLLFIILSVPMAIMRPPDSGWDADGHIDYIRYVAEKWGVPSGEQGWEMYQPPAYYFVAAVVYRAFLPQTIRASEAPQPPTDDFPALKAVQLMTPFFALLQILIVLKTLALFNRNRPSSAMVAALIVLLPMQLYVSSFISNEVFASLAITASLFLMVYVVSGDRYGIVLSLALGAALSLACLSKYTGLVVVATMCFVYGVTFLRKSVNRKKLIVSFTISSAIVMSLAGPFYYRNYIQYGRLLPVNQELRKCPSLDYRGLGFYIDPSSIGIGAIDKFVSRTVSFPEGNYSSMWLDHSHKPRPRTFWLEGTIYYLALFPTFLIIAGFFRSISALRTNSDSSKACFPILTVWVLALFAYHNYILHISQFETVRAFYLLSQITPLAVFFQAGVENTTRFSGRTKLWVVVLSLLYGSITLYYLLIPLLAGKGL